MSSANEESKQADAPSTNVQPARAQGPPIVFKLQAADHDTRRAYNLSEASANMTKYRNLVQQQSGNPDSWFSLYELLKVRPAQPNLRVDLSGKSFGDLEETVGTLEKLWKACGYDFVRRPNFNDAVALNPTRTAEDLGLMLSLLIAENEWEMSITAYRLGNESQGKAKYLVVADPMHTPQTKSAPKQMKQLVDANTDLDDEDVWKSTKVQKKLDFDDSDSDFDVPMKTAPKSSNPVVDTLMNLVKAGHMTMEELAKVATMLSANGEQVDGARSAPRASTFSQAPKKSSRRERSEVDWEYEIEMTAQDGAAWNTSGRPVTVLQNLNIRTFDGAKISPEEARAWLSKFMHVANLSGWTAKQRLEMFIDSLTNPAKHWVRQLPADVKADWSAILAAFKQKYCTDIVPPRLQYYKLTQKSDELASNYLYRLNGAALRAGLDFRDDTTDHLEDHIQQYFDTLHDKTLQMQFRFTAFDSIDELEKKVLQYESTQLRPAKKAGIKKAADDGIPDGAPAVNRIDRDQRTGGGHGGGLGGGNVRQQAQGDYKPVRPPNQNTIAAGGGQEQQSTKIQCEHCRKVGHTIDKCWQLMTCEYCNERGHPIKYCRVFIEKMANLHTQSRSGELTPAQVAEQLNQ